MTYSYNLVQFGYANSEFTIGDLDYAYVCSTFLFPLIRDFAPQAIIISCGFDSAQGDALGGVGLTPTGYAWMTRGLMEICPHIISVLEGGYDLQSLARCSEGVVRTMMGGEFGKVLKEIGSEYGSYEEIEEASKKRPREAFKRLIEQMREDLEKGERPEDEPKDEIVYEAADVGL